MKKVLFSVSVVFFSFFILTATANASERYTPSYLPSNTDGIDFPYHWGPVPGWNNLDYITSYHTHAGMTYGFIKDLKFDYIGSGPAGGGQVIILTLSMPVSDVADVGATARNILPPWQEWIIPAYYEPAGSAEGESKYILYFNSVTGGLEGREIGITVTKYDWGGSGSGSYGDGTNLEFVMFQFR